MRFTFGGGAEARTPVHNILSEKDYTFRLVFSNAPKYLVLI